MLFNFHNEITFLFQFWKVKKARLCYLKLLCSVIMLAQSTTAFWGEFSLKRVPNNENNENFGSVPFLFSLSYILMCLFFRFLIRMNPKKCSLEEKVRDNQSLSTQMINHRETRIIFPSVSASTSETLSAVSHVQTYTGNVYGTIRYPAPAV